MIRRPTRPADLLRYIVPKELTLVQRDDLAALLRFFHAHLQQDQLILDFSDDAQAYADASEEIVEAWEGITPDVIMRVRAALQGVRS